jgi:putative flippase GtrA
VNSLISSIFEGLRSIWADPALRAFFSLIAISNFLVNGPLFVGIPVLAASRYSEGVAAFGIIMSAYGGGSLLGTVLAGLLPKPPLKKMGVILGVVWSGLGFGVVLQGLLSSTILSSATAFAMGIAQGYVVILFITWLQSRTGEAMLGRMMSLLLLASVGLQPISFILTGALVGIDPRALFITAGGLMVIIVFLFMLNPKVRSMESSMIGQPSHAEQAATV